MTAALATLPDLLGTSPADLLVGVDRHDSTPDEARQRAERLRAGIVRYAEMRQDIADAFACRDWLVLGYDNWPAYVSGEFGDQLAQLARGERREAIADLRSQGMSTRQIADATGMPKSTVSDAVRQLSESGQLSQPERITGADGRERPASRPTPSPGPTGAALSPPADPGANPECLGVDMDCGRPLPCPDHPTLDLGASPAPAVESPAPAAPREPDPIPEPGGAMSAAQPSGSGSTAAAVPGEGGAAAAQDRFDAVLDQHVPDPDAPKRAWGRELYTRVKPVHDFLLWLKTEDVAAFADEQDVTTLRHLATGFAEAHRRAVEARTATVTPLRRIK